MARFRFRLEPVLKLRAALEKEAQRKLARTLAFLQQLRDRREETEAQRRAVFEARRSEQGQAIDLAFLKDGERHLVLLERRLALLREQIQEAEGSVARAREELRQAHKDHLVLLRLKERREAQHHLEEQRKTTIELDELAVLRYRFRRTG